MDRVTRVRNLFLCGLFFALLASSIGIAVANNSSSVKVYIVYTMLPQDEEPEAYHMRILSAALGSEEAAKGALVYHYRLFGFAAKLTPDQAAQVSKQPGVLGVHRDVGGSVDNKHY